MGEAIAAGSIAAAAEPRVARRRFRRLGGAAAVPCGNDRCSPSGRRGDGTAADALELV